MTRAFVPHVRRVTQFAQARKFLKVKAEHIAILELLIQRETARRNAAAVSGSDFARNPGRVYVHAAWIESHEVGTISRRDPAE